MSVHILALVGSLRSGSHNRQLAEAAVQHAPEGVKVTLYEGPTEVPFYNEDIDTDEQRPAASTRHCARPPRAPTRSCSSPPSTTAPCPPC